MAQALSNRDSTLTDPPLVRLDRSSGARENRGCQALSVLQATEIGTGVKQIRSITRVRMPTKILPEPRLHSS